MNEKLQSKSMDEIKNAIDILKDGGIVIFPTDTAFGIGCRIDNEKAVKKLFKIRKRPQNQAVPVLVDSIEMAQKYLEPIPAEVQDLMKKYWPGGLTIILRCIRVKVPDLVRAGGETLGVRMPNHSKILQVIKGVGVPILGTSANFYEEKTPYEFSDLDQQLLEMVDFVFPGEILIKEQSTVLDVSQKPWKILRQGAVKIKGL